jgi:hypothetical protein
MYRLNLGVLVALSFLISKPAFCFVSGVVDYVKQYQIGIDYSNSIDTVKLTYDTDAAGGTPSSCKAVEGNAAKKECSVDMVAGGSSGFGLFLQRAFKKQGFWYFDYDLGFGARYLSGGIEKKNESLQGLPLKQAKFSLLSLVGKPYIQFGITPDRFPDILLSVGPAIQVAMGNVSINDQSEKVVTGTSSYQGPMSLWHGFFELEIVLKRFGEGAFSVFSSSDFTGSGEGTKIYPKDVDGMSNFRGAFSHSVGGAAFGFGLKLVTPFP